MMMRGGGGGGAGIIKSRRRRRPPPPQSLIDTGRCIKHTHFLCMWLLCILAATSPCHYYTVSAATPPFPRSTTTTTTDTTTTTRGGATTTTTSTAAAAIRRRKQNFQQYPSSSSQQQQQLLSSLTDIIIPNENRHINSNDDDNDDTQQEETSQRGRHRFWGEKLDVDKLKRDLQQQEKRSEQGRGVGRGGKRSETTTSILRKVWNKGIHIGWNLLESVSLAAAVKAVVVGSSFRGGGGGGGRSSSSGSWNSNNNTKNLSLVDSLARSLVLVMGQLVILQSLASILTTNDFHVLDQVVSRVLDPECTAAIKTVREIITSVNDHGVVDVFKKYTIRHVTSSIYALSRLQRAAQEWQRLQVMPSSDDDDDNNSDDEYDIDNDSSLSSSSSSSSCYPIVKDAKLLEDLAHYAVYASTAYGWTMDLVFGGDKKHHHHHPWRPFGRKGQERRQRDGGGGGGRLPTFANGSLQTLLRRTGIHRRDVVAAVWESKTHRPAYFLVRDHAKHTLVLCIRGTYSAHDVLTDLCCTAEEFEPLSPPAVSKSTRLTTTRAVVSSDATSNNIQEPKSVENSWTVLTVIPDLCFDIAEYCCTITSSLSSVFFDRRQRCCGHHGMLQAARALHQDAEALVRAELQAHPDYSLVLVGHSMGGGVAALLGTLWEDVFGEHRIGAVYLYGAPCVAPLDARPTGTRGNSNNNNKIVSVVMHGDPFGRWSLGHVADVSVDLAHLCENEQLRRVIFLHTDGDLDKADLQWCAATMQDLRQHRRRTANSNSGTATLTTEGTTLYPPGRILYLSPETKKEKHNATGRRRARGRHSSKRSTIVRQVPPEFFSDFIISPSMFDLTKHVPALYESSLRAAAIHARS